MKVVFERAQIPPPPEDGRVVTIGVFDGVHVGHVAILRETVRTAAAMGAEPAVLTFRSHPRALISGEAPPSICSLEQRLQLFDLYGIRVAVALPFEEELRNLRADQFLEEIVQKELGARALVLGHDSRFGKNRKGDAEYARDRGWEVHVVPPVLINNVRASSGHVRDAIHAGRLDDAAALLGRPVTLRGTVVRGDGRGKSLGFGTANLQLHHEAKPPHGVYAASVTVGGGERLAVVNIGTRPTFGENRETVEVHIPCWTKDLYGEVLDVTLISKVRGEKRFPSPDSLKFQIARDIDEARAIYISRDVNIPIA